MHKNDKDHSKRLRIAKHGPTHRTEVPDANHDSPTQNMGPKKRAFTRMPLPVVKRNSESLAFRRMGQSGSLCRRVPHLKGNPSLINCGGDIDQGTTQCLIPQISSTWSIRFSNDTTNHMSFHFHRQLTGRSVNSPTDMGAWRLDRNCVWYFGEFTQRKCSV